MALMKASQRIFICGNCSRLDLLFPNLFTNKINYSHKWQENVESVEKFSGIKMSLSDFPWIFSHFFRFFRFFFGELNSKPQRKPLKSSKDFILSYVCIKMCSRLVLSKVSEQVKWCHKFSLQNKYTFLSQPTLNFIELENLFKMIFFCCFSVGTCQKFPEMTFASIFTSNFYIFLELSSW